MAFISVPNTLMAELIYSGSNGLSENTLYFQKDTAVQDSDPEEIALMLTSWWTANVKPLISSGLTLNRIEVTDLSTEDSFFVAMPVADGAGAVAIGALPNNVSVAVKFNTNRSGRSFRGRNYVLGLSDSQVTGDAIDAAVRTSYIAAYTQLMDDAGTAGYTWVVASRYMNNAPRATGVATRIEFVTMDGTLDSQRRRLYGRGR